MGVVVALQKKYEVAILIVVFSSNILEYLFWTNVNCSFDCLDIEECFIMLFAVYWFPCLQQWLKITNSKPVTNLLSIFAFILKYKVFYSQERW